MTRGPRSSARHVIPLVTSHWAGDKAAKFVRLEPGKEHTVFKAPLRDVLLLDRDKAKPLKPAEPRYYWSWDK